MNEVVVPGITNATTIAFLPDGRMLVGELTRTIWVVQPGANQQDPTPFLQLGLCGPRREQGLMDILPDPNFASNDFYYVFYTRVSGRGNHNRVSRFTASGNTTVANSELVLWQDDVDAGDEHHGGTLAIGNDGKLYFTYGEQGFPPRAGSALLRRQGPAHQPRRHGADRQSVLRRRGPEQGPDLGLRPPQPVPHVDRSGDGPHVHRRRRRQQHDSSIEEVEPRRPRRQLRLAAVRGELRASRA